MLLKPEDYFTPDGWRLNPNILQNKGWASAVVEELPGDEETVQIAKLLEGQEVNLIYRNVFNNIDEYINSKSVVVQKGNIDEIIFDYTLCPFILTSTNPEFLLFIPDDNQYHVVCGPKDTVEKIIKIIGKTIAEARSRFDVYAAISPPDGQANFKKIADTYFRDTVT